MEESRDEVVSETGERRNIHGSMAWFLQRQEGNRSFHTGREIHSKQENNWQKEWSHNGYK